MNKDIEALKEKILKDGKANVTIADLKDNEIIEAIREKMVKDGIVKTTIGPLNKDEIQKLEDTDFNYISDAYESARNICVGENILGAKATDLNKEPVLSFTFYRDKEVKEAHEQDNNNTPVMDEGPGMGGK